MEGSGRGLHLAAYASSAGKAKKKNERLTPTQYKERKSAAGGAKVVVLLLGHKGVSRPDAWLGLIDACPAVALLVHAEVELPERLEVWRFPRSQVTAWEDITLFVLIRRMLKYALNAYRHATIVYTCSGDGIPIVNGDTLERPWAHVGLPEGSPILGINPNDTRITVPEWEPIRQSALADHGLPPMPVACYGSQWVGLTRSDAEAVVAAGEKYGSALAGAYRTAYAHAVDGHGQGHARLHPDEEFLPYVLLVLSARPWPEVYGCVMAEATDASPSRCPLCRFRVGHGAVLTPAREERVRTRLSPSCLFLRKVTPLQEAGRRQEEEQLQEARQRQEEEHQERQQQHEQQQQEPQQQGHEGSTSEGGGSYTGTRARSRPHAHVRMHPYIHTHVSPPSHTYPHTHTHTHTHTHIQAAPPKTSSPTSPNPQPRPLHTWTRPRSWPATAMCCYAERHPQNCVRACCWSRGTSIGKPRADSFARSRSSKAHHGAWAACLQRRRPGWSSWTPMPPGRTLDWRGVCGGCRCAASASSRRSLRNLGTRIAL